MDRLLFALALVCMTSGCGTFINVVNPMSPGWDFYPGERRVYGGVRTDAMLVRECVSPTHKDGKGLPYTLLPLSWC